MREDDRVFLLGEDIGVFGGAFGVTAGLLDEFGEQRVIDTPISEEGFVGAAIGAAWMGERPVVELQFADFITCAFDPIVTVAAKTHWRSGQAIPVTIRCPPAAASAAARSTPARRRDGSSGRPASRSSARERWPMPTGSSGPRSRIPIPSSTSSTSASTGRSAPSARSSHRTAIGPARDRENRHRRDRRHLRLGRRHCTRGDRAHGRRRRGRRPAHDLAARRGHDPLVRREDLARAGAAGGRPAPPAPRA